ncbi:unnamed protein product, partial [Didymodactylos carnosus]
MEFAEKGYGEVRDVSFSSE